MKRLFSFVLALALVLSLSVTAFAATGTGTITITNATVGQTYNLYKIFDASYAKNPDNTIKLENGKPVINYTIDPQWTSGVAANPYFLEMFGTDGKSSNEFFNYVAGTNEVTKKNTVGNDAELIAYLTALVKKNTIKDTYVDSKSITTGDEIVFTGLDTGYYLVERGNGSAVTLTTNTPDASIIDKNQIPGNGFAKTMIEKDALGNEHKVTTNSVGIGEEVDFDISFTATNYYGDKQVQYYTITDSKTSSLWAEFNSIEVYVGGEKKDKGYYFFAGPVNDPNDPTKLNPAETNEWEFLGTWTPEEKAAANHASLADWYLIHIGYDDFKIIIPWVKNHTFEYNKADNTYTLSFPADADLESKFDATEPLTVRYSAIVGPDAALGPVTNTATLTWEDTGLNPGGGNTSKTESEQFNLGITKVSKGDNSRLAGATFELYADEACTEEVWVIPTGIEGVYIVDDIDADISGYERVTVREKYAGTALNDWLAADPKPDSDGTNRRNDMTTTATGQLIVLGLEADLTTGTTYYVKETEAPAGYNKLTSAVGILVGSGPTVSYTADKQYTVYGKSIENSSGVELPSTGAQGTMMMITFGTVMALAFAILLITHKKMSVYHD